MADLIHTSRPNPKIVEDLESTYSEVLFEEPIFDHHEKLEDFIETLEYVEKEDRESEVLSWIKPVLDTKLNLWKDRYRNNTKLIQDANKEKRHLEKLRSDNEQKLAQIDAEIEESKKENEELQIDRKHWLKESEHQFNWTFHKSSMITFMIATIVLGIVSLYSYIDAKSTIWWTQKDIPEKMMTIQRGFDEGIEEFKYFYTVRGNEKPSEEHLDIEKVTAVDRLSVSQYSSLEGGDVLIACGAGLIFLIIGKGFAWVYGLIGRPRWYIITGVGLLLVLIANVAWLFYAVQVESNKISELNGKIASIEVKIEDIRDAETFSSQGRNSRSSNQRNFQGEIAPLELEKSQLTDNLNSIQTDFKSYNASFAIASLFAEMLVSMLAWISLSDYLNNKVIYNGGARQKISVLEKIINENNSKSNSLKSDAESLHNDNDLIVSLIARLEALLSKIMTKDSIAAIANDYRLQEISFAKQALQKHNHNWLVNE